MSSTNNIELQNYESLKFNPLNNFKFQPLQVSRVSQLDSQLLDTELQTLLKDQFWQSFSLLKNNLKTKFEDEVSLLLKGACFYFSMLTSSKEKGSYGNKLQNLKFDFNLDQKSKSSSKSVTNKILIFGLLNIGGPYLIKKLVSNLQKSSWNSDEDSLNHRFLLYLQKFLSFIKYLNFLNYCWFLVDGKYLTLVGRLLRMKLVYDKKLSNRQISYEFLNRQLIWDAFSEFLMFLIPLINLQKLQTRIKKLTQSKNQLGGENSEILSKLSDDKCAICYYEKYLNTSSIELGSNELNPKFLGSDDCALQLPYQANCGHLFCYACISTNLQSDPDYSCLVCNEKVTNLARYKQINE